MSANPFQDPRSHGLDGNPFEDPSVRAAQTHGGSIYPDDPFDSASKGASTASIGQVPTLGRDDTASRLAEIERREREVAQREVDVQRRAEHVQKHGRNNWPPFWPFMYHDISAEIPSESQPIVLTLYRLWLLLIITLIINVVACILLLVSGTPDGGKDVGAGIMYLPVIAISSFFLWYRPVYNAYMKEHSLFYYLYFLFCGFHIAFCVYMFIGIPSTGSGGLINTIHSFATGAIVAGVFCLLSTIGWALEGLVALYTYQSVWRHHHEKGHTFAQAKNELATHGAKAYFNTNRGGT